jgi:Zn finger protein HypA/HybF involved in hydrogenase expression
MTLISEDSYLLHREEYDGWCVKCRDWTMLGSCEPDARQYLCPTCERPTVFGAEEAIMIGSIGIRGDAEGEDYPD